MYVASLIYDANLDPVLQFMYSKHVVLGHFLKIKFVFLILIFFNMISMLQRQILSAKASKYLIMSLIKIEDIVVKRPRLQFYWPL